MLLGVVVEHGCKKLQHAAEQVPTGQRGADVAAEGVLDVREDVHVAAQQELLPVKLEGELLQADVPHASTAVTQALASFSSSTTAISKRL